MSPEQWDKLAGKLDAVNEHLRQIHTKVPDLRVWVIVVAAVATCDHAERAADALERLAAPAVADSARGGR